MASANRFSECTSTYAVHIKLGYFSCCEYLHEVKCKTHFNRFKWMCRNHLTTPTEQSLHNPTEILDRLEQKGLFGVGDYEIFKTLVKGYDELLDLIDEAEERISLLRGNEYNPNRVQQRSKRVKCFDHEIEAGNMIKLRARLKDINKHETEAIPVSPLQEHHKLPIDKLFASVVIIEEHRYNSRMRGYVGDTLEHENKIVKSPDDIFTINGHPTRRVYMQGDAARGKTTFCLWLLKQWCDAEHCTDEPQNEWIEAMKTFDFVFYLPLRHVNPSRETVQEMICKEVLHEDPNLHEAARYVLMRDKYRCLVILDGLDEWNKSKKVLTQLRCKALPNFDNISNCVYFSTMRPWLFSAVTEFIRNNDRVIEIKGLADDAITKVVEKVLVNHYGLTTESSHYKSRYEKIMGNLKNKTLRSFIQIPLLAVVCAQIWHKDEHVGNSMTMLYIAMVDILLDRELKKNTREYKRDEDMSSYSFPQILLENENIQNNISALVKIGKVAYNGLLSSNESLVFQKGNIEKDIGQTVYQFALGVGLISQREAHSVAKKNVRVHFFHRSVQELLAAIYIITKEEFFTAHLTDVKSIIRLSNVIMFICGMNPSMGNAILRHIAQIANVDEEIIQYRRSHHSNSLVEELYKLQVACYRELGNSQLEENIVYYELDVHLTRNSDLETVRVTRELLSEHHSCIRSLYLNMIPTDGEHGVSNEVLNAFLSERKNTLSLEKVYINGFDTGRFINKICGPNLQTLSLCIVNIHGNDNDVHKDCIETSSSRVGHKHFLKKRHSKQHHLPPLLSADMKMLCKLELDGVSTGNRDLGLVDHMIDLESVRLCYVHMSTAGWFKFIRSLMSIQPGCFFELSTTNIEEESREHILRTFDVSKCSYDEHGNFDLEFQRKRLRPHSEPSSSTLTRMGALMNREELQSLIHDNVEEENNRWWHWCCCFSWCPRKTQSKYDMHELLHI